MIEPADHDARALRRRRQKPQLSCNLCRQSKLRCDRLQPCNNCSRKGVGNTCTFAHSESRASKPTSSTDSYQSQQPTVKNRVKQLEDQVGALVEALQRQDALPLAQTGDTLPTPQSMRGHSRDYGSDKNQTDQYQFPLADTPGFIEFSSAGVSYVGSSHWMSIMQGIPEIKDVLANHAHVMEDNTRSAGEDADLQEPDLFLGSNGNITRQDVLDCLPPRAVADSLIANSFKDTTNESMIIHAPTFRKEYDKFWDNQSETPIVWVGLLFALMCLAVQYEQFSPNESRRQQILDLQPERLVHKFRRKSIQCLIMGRYMNGPQYAVETLLLNLFIEALRGENTKNMNSCWALWGTVVRICQRAGFHRDGSHFPALSPFRAEMRRRAWLIIVEWDMYLAIQFGLPRMIDHSKCDTRKPRNLYDEDLYEDLVELPPERPESARTQPQFHGAKNELLMVFAKIQDLVSSTTPFPYTEVSKLDSQLTKTYESLLHVWQAAAEVLKATDHASATYICVGCSFLAFMYHRAQITLHRRYMIPGRTDPRYQWSYTVCVDAAISILQLQWSLYLDTQVGGDLCRHGWKFLTLLEQDFLCGTAILCAELGEELALARSRDERHAVNGHEGGARETDLRDRVVHALSGASIVWLRSRNFESSHELKFLAAALKALLGKAQRAGFGQSVIATPSSSTTSRRDAAFNTPQDRHGDEYSAEYRGTEGDSYWGIGLFPI